MAQIQSTEKHSCPLSAHLSAIHHLLCQSNEGPESSLQFLVRSWTPVSTGYLRVLTWYSGPRLMSPNYVNICQWSPSGFLETLLKLDTSQVSEGSPPTSLSQKGLGNGLRAEHSLSPKKHSSLIPSQKFSLYLLTSMELWWGWDLSRLDSWITINKCKPIYQRPSYKS